MRKTQSLSFLIAAATLTYSASIAAFAIPRPEQRIKASAAGPAQAAAGKPFDLVVTVEVQQGYHIQANTAKDPYIPTSISVTAPTGFKTGSPVFPAAKVEEFFGEKLKVFDGKITVKVPIIPAAN